MDVEGYEGLILNGGKRLFEEAPPPFLLLEYYPSRLKLNGWGGTGLVDRLLAVATTALRQARQEERI